MTDYDRLSAAGGSAKPNEPIHVDVLTSMEQPRLIPMIPKLINTGRRSATSVQYCYRDEGRLTNRTRPRVFILLVYIWNVIRQDWSRQVNGRIKEVDYTLPPPIQTCWYSHPSAINGIVSLSNAEHPWKIKHRFRGAGLRRRIKSQYSVFRSFTTFKHLCWEHL